ncbi:unnamed protein product [Caenorhabditis angaria]|uniref:RING-type domain-containing protein n=1 Tax=Caenorhabditis angaria TaxID=860376 RepID=A0A9P1J5J3_9PELO|nr:unnamed protein product [Caenorhabditis angaria]
MADVFPKIECTICSGVMDYGESKTGFRKCNHYLHSKCFDKWMETFDDKNTNKPYCPSCKEVGNCVDTVLQEPNGKFSKTSRNINENDANEDHAEAEKCEVCLMSWNTENIVTCTDCSTSEHKYCLKNLHEMEQNISWLCDSCWVKKVVSTKGVVNVPVLPEHQKWFNQELTKCFYTSCQEIFKTKKRIAIIGSGPCGLSAAKQLLYRGHSVDVFEKNAKCGGLLGEGFLTMENSRLSIDEYIEKLKKRGIRFFCNKNVSNTDIRFCFKQYDAIIICTGARIVRSYLPADINNTVGVFSMTKFLPFDEERKQRLDDINAADKRVIYITNDRVSEARKISFFEKHCKNLEIIEILPQPKKGCIIDTEHELPEWRCFIKSDSDTMRIDNRKEFKGVRMEPIIKRIITRRSLLGQRIFEGLETTTVTLPISNSSKFFNENFEECENSNIITADLMIVSDGCIEPRTKFTPDFGLNYDDSSNIITDSYATGTDKVFAAGDCCNGETAISYAVMEGFRVALEVHKFVMGIKPRQEETGISQHLF